MNRYVFNSMQSVKVNNDTLEHDGQAGYVVRAVEIFDTDTESTVSVKIDADSEVYEFNPRDLVAL
jgi:uncharacterized protein YkuJ